jgi:CAAX protease family protein
MQHLDLIEIDQLKSIGITIILAILANCVFNIFGFYKFPHPIDSREERLSSLLILKAFIIFLISSLIIIPSVTSLWFMLNGGSIPEKLPSYTETWLHLISIGLTLTLFTAFILLIGQSTRRVIFGKPTAWFNNLFTGCGAWFVAYPTVLFIGNLLSFLIFKIFGEQVVDQLAVEKLKNTTEYPFQFQVMTFAIIFVVPFIEELLFRGFLQTWLRQHIGRVAAIFTTSIIFAFFHYSSSQGITNIQLVTSLFILSCYLGFLRERQQSIWAPIGLHSLFNGVSILILHVSSS